MLWKLYLGIWWHLGIFFCGISSKQQQKEAIYMSISLPIWLNGPVLD